MINEKQPPEPIIGYEGFGLNQVDLRDKAFVIIRSLTKKNTEEDLQAVAAVGEERARRVLAETKLPVTLMFLNANDFASVLNALKFELDRTSDPRSRIYEKTFTVDTKE